MPVLTQNPFIEIVQKCGVVDPVRLAKRIAAGLPDEPRAAADCLVKEGLLTRFQANLLLAGRHRGLVFGPYKLLDQIGRGGMGIVYLAQHDKLQRRVAIKILPKDRMDDHLALDRFYREARAVAALDHPNIVKAYDVGEHQGIHYFVMEYVQGVNLQMHLKQKGPLPWRYAVQFIAQACEGLQHAHERGLVHRDIKPGNLLVDPGGTLKILDLGLARCFLKEQDALTIKHTSGSEVIGSVDYMAPELALGAAHVDIRSDVYSLGVTLFALIVGKPPFAGSPAQTLLQHQMKPLPVLHELRPEVPETLSAVVARMTQKAPDKRYPTPVAVLDALAPWLNVGATRIRVVSNGQLPAAIPEAPAPRDTSTHERRGNRETRAILDEDTQESTATFERRTGTHRRRRLKKQRRERRTRRLVYVALAAAVVIPLATWGAAWAIMRPSAAGVQLAAATDSRSSPSEAPPSAPPAAAPPAAPAPSPPSAPNLPTPPASSGRQDEGLAVGQVAPEIDGEDLNNECFLLSDFRGKVVLLDFWGFW